MNQVARLVCKRVAIALTIEVIVIAGGRAADRWLRE